MHGAAGSSEDNGVGRNDERIGPKDVVEDDMLLEGNFEAPVDI